MKTLFISLLLSIVFLHLSAQNITTPYASIGTKALPVVNLMSFGNPIFEVRKSKHKWIKRA